MEKDRGARVVAIMALCVAVIGLSIGFSAFSRSLTISTAATVKTDDSVFQVQFSKLADSQSYEAITPTYTPVKTTLTDGSFEKTYFEATNATIGKNGEYYTTLSNINVTFAKPGESVEYTFYVRNTGELTAYLNKISFGDADEDKTDISCEAIGDTDTDLVAEACEHITVQLNIADEDYAETHSISGVSLAKGAYQKAVLTISYTDSTETSSAYADGDFTVTVGDIVLDYSSVDANA